VAIFKNNRPIKLIGDGEIRFLFWVVTNNIATQRELIMKRRRIRTYRAPSLFRVEKTIRDTRDFNRFFELK